MKWWKCTRRLRTSGTQRKNASIRKLLPRPTGPQRYTPFGSSGRTKRRFSAFERRAL